jgi:hypothetical protein
MMSLLKKFLPEAQSKNHVFFVNQDSRERGAGNSTGDLA